MNKNLKFFLGSLTFTFIIVFSLNVFSQKNDSVEPSFHNTQLESTKKIKPLNVNIDISAEAAGLVEINKKGEMIFHWQKQKNKKLRIASLTKLMTALIVKENPDIYNFSMPIKLKLKDGLTFNRTLEKSRILSLKTLLHMLLIESNNVAAYTISEVIGESAFVQMMNLKAKELNMKNTNFANTSGLEEENKYNYSTVHDLVLLGQYIKENYPEILKISKKKTYHVFDFNNEFYYFIPESTNKLLFSNPNIIGGKTGWTPKAGQCLLTIFSHPQNNNYFISIVLNSKDRFGDTQKIIKEINYAY